MKKTRVKQQKVIFKLFALISLTFALFIFLSFKAKERKPASRDHYVNEGSNDYILKHEVPKKKENKVASLRFRSARLNSTTVRGSAPEPRDEK